MKHFLTGPKAFLTEIAWYFQIHLVYSRPYAYIIMYAHTGYYTIYF